jgi:hypothetical protein
MWFLLQAKPPLNWQLFQFLSNSFFLLKKVKTHLSRILQYLDDSRVTIFSNILCCCCVVIAKELILRTIHCFHFFEVKHCLNDIFHMFLIHFMHYYVYMTCQKMFLKNQNVSVFCWISDKLLSLLLGFSNYIEIGYIRKTWVTCFCLYSIYDQMNMSKPT